MHARVAIFNRGGLAGELTISAGDLEALLSLLFYDQDNEAMYTHYGGASSGCIVEERVPNLDNDMQLLDEYCTLTTVREVREKTGAGKATNNGKHIPGES